MKKIQMVLALALAAPLTTFAADQISYSYLEAGYGLQTLEGGDVPAGPPGFIFTIEDTKAKGFHIAGSAELGGAFHLFGGYRQGNDDDVRITATNFAGIPGTIPTSFEVDLKQFNFGVGYHHGLSDRTDLVTDISYLHTDVEVDGQGEDGDDYRVGVGLRGLLTDNFEGWIKGNYTDGDAYDGEFSGTVGAQVKFNQTWGLVGEAEFGDKYSQYLIGIRASF